MFALVQLFDNLIGIYIWVIILSAIASWLIAFDIINIKNPFIYRLYVLLGQLTEPVYRPIRALLPDMGGLDLSPLIVLLGLSLLRNFLWASLG
ncbi:MAG: YggT family protein [Alphaproteobacteria bacterium]|nr:YggT family protein [Alphaproteobacteria bacterium]MBE8220173.1 YggT family protein [Alphaproteobacteria bacterium]